VLIYLNARWQYCSLAVYRQLLTVVWM
jgi:hypothetical protein